MSPYKYELHSNGVINRLSDIRTLEGQAQFVEDFVKLTERSSFDYWMNIATSDRYSSSQRAHAYNVLSADAYDELRNKARVLSNSGNDSAAVTNVTTLSKEIARAVQLFHEMRANGVKVSTESMQYY